MKRKPNIAIIGATGLVGLTMLKVLEEINLEIGSLYLYASNSSKDKVLKFKNDDYIIQELKEDSFSNKIDIALFATNKEISKQYIPIAVKAGVYVIDNSSYYRNSVLVPLVVAGVNDYLINKESYIVANPNCSTIESVLALAEVDKLYKLKRVIYNTYQAVSGSGYRGVLDLVNTIEGKENSLYEKPIAYNLIPIIGDLDEDKISYEEKKMINETKRIFNNPNLLVSATCVRVPVVNSHSISINVECSDTVDINQLIKNLKENELLKIYEEGHPTPKEVSGSDLVHIGRIRYDDSVENGLNMWVVADNLRVGAATNAIRILNKLWEEIGYAI